VVDVQHRPCAPSNSTDFPSSARFTSSRYANIRDLFAQLQRLFHFMGKINVRSVRPFARRFFSLQRAPLSCETAPAPDRVPQTAPCHFVFVSRTIPRDVVNLIGAPRAFRRFVQLDTENQMRAIVSATALSHQSPPSPKSRSRHQSRRIHHNAGSNHRLLLRPQNPAGISCSTYRSLMMTVCLHLPARHAQYNQRDPAG
jgi:hypothetical protein